MVKKKVSAKQKSAATPKKIQSSYKTNVYALSSIVAIVALVAIIGIVLLVAKSGAKVNVETTGKAVFQLKEEGNFYRLASCEESNQHIKQRILELEREREACKSASSSSSSGKSGPIADTSVKVDGPTVEERQIPQAQADNRGYGQVKDAQKNMKEFGVETPQPQKETRESMFGFFKGAFVGQAIATPTVAYETCTPQRKILECMWEKDDEISYQKSLLRTCEEERKSGVEDVRPVDQKAKPVGELETEGRQIPQADADNRGYGQVKDFEKNTAQY